jgi:hypothetical protein
MLLLLATRVSAQSSLICAEWIKWTDDAKMFYLVGWVDGRQSGNFEATQQFAPAIAEHWKTDKRVNALQSNVTVGQINKGVTSFCADYRNEHVDVRSAVEIVFREASGFHHYSEIELAAIRRVSATEKRTP